MATQEEKYEEWLGRLEVPLEEAIDIESFQAYLKEELGITGEAQIEALWGAVGLKMDLATYGIHSVRVEYPWGVEVRYGIKGAPGLWGWDAVMAYLEEIRG